ncbi:hypothetical protein Emag_004312 [Eimeria magna]
MAQGGRLRVWGRSSDVQVQETEQQIPAEMLLPVVRQEAMLPLQFQSRSKGSRGMLVSALAVSMSVVAIVLLTTSCYFWLKARGGFSLTLASRRLAQGVDPEACGGTGDAAGSQGEPAGRPQSVDTLRAEAAMQLEILEAIEKDDSYFTEAETNSIEKAKQSLQATLLQLTTALEVSDKIQAQVGELEKEIEELRKPTLLTPFTADTFQKEQDLADLRQQLVGLFVEKNDARSALERASYSPTQARNALLKLANSYDMRAMTPVGAAALSAAEKVLTGGPTDIPPLNVVQKDRIGDIVKSTRVRLRVACQELGRPTLVSTQRVARAEELEQSASLLIQQLFASGEDGLAMTIDPDVAKLRDLCRRRRNQLGLEPPKSLGVAPPALPLKKSRPRAPLPPVSLPQRLEHAASSAGSTATQESGTSSERPVPTPPPSPRGAESAVMTESAPFLERPLPPPPASSSRTGSPPPKPPRRGESLRKSRGQAVAADSGALPEVREPSSGAESDDEEAPPPLPLRPPESFRKSRRGPVGGDLGARPKVREPFSGGESDEDGIPPPLPARPPVSGVRPFSQLERVQRETGGPRPASVPTGTSAGVSSGGNEPDYVDMRPRSDTFRAVEYGPQKIIIGGAHRRGGSRLRQESPERYGGRSESRKSPVAAALIRLQAAAHNLISDLVVTSHRLDEAAAVKGPQLLTQRINAFSGAIVKLIQVTSTTLHRAVLSETKAAYRDAVRRCHIALLQLQATLSEERLSMTADEALAFEQASHQLSELGPPPPPSPALLPSSGSDEDTAGKSDVTRKAP